MRRHCNGEAILTSRLLYVGLVCSSLLESWIWKLTQMTRPTQAVRTRLAPCDRKEHELIMHLCRRRGCLPHSHSRRDGLRNHMQHATRCHSANLPNVEEAPLYPLGRHHRQQSQHHEPLQNHDARVPKAGGIWAGPGGHLAGIARLVGGANRRPG